MAVRKPATNNAVSNKSFEEATAYLNVSVKLEDGSTTQIGGIPLLASKALHEAVMAAGIENLDLTLEIRQVEKKDASDFKFAPKAA